MYFLYIIQCKDKSLYTGISTDVARRFMEHKNGTGGHYTRSHKPVKIIHREACGTRSRALKREAEVKRLTREQKLELCEK